MCLFDRILNAGYEIRIYKYKDIYSVLVCSSFAVSHSENGSTIEEATKLCVEYLGV